MAKKDFRKHARDSVASTFFTSSDKPIANSVVVEEADSMALASPAPSVLKATSFSLEGEEQVPCVLPPYRINLKLKGEYKEYLDQVSWENRMSITQYLNDLIARDMEFYQQQKS